MRASPSRGNSYAEDLLSDTFSVIAWSTGDQSVTNLYCGEQRCSQVWLWLPNPHLRAYAHFSTSESTLTVTCFGPKSNSIFFPFFPGILGSQEDKSKHSCFIDTKQNQILYSYKDEVASQDCFRLYWIIPSWRNQTQSNKSPRTSLFVQ